MPSPLLQPYTQHLNEIKMRLHHLEKDLMASPSRTGQLVNEEILVYERRCLQLRKVLELVAFSCLIAHKDSFSKLFPTYSEFWRAKNVIDKLKKNNPHFFPVPFEISVRSGVNHIEGIELPSAFAVRDFAPLFDACSEVIHVKNPFALQTPVNIGRPMLEWINRIRALLNQHTVYLDADTQIGAVVHGWERPGAEAFILKAE